MQAACHAPRCMRRKPCGFRRRILVHLRSSGTPSFEFTPRGWANLDSAGYLLDATRGRGRHGRLAHGSRPQLPLLAPFANYMLGSCNHRFGWYVSADAFDERFPDVPRSPNARTPGSTARQCRPWRILGATCSPDPKRQPGKRSDHVETCARVAQPRN